MQYAQGGYVFIYVRLLVCMQGYTKTAQWISMGLGWVRVGMGLSPE